MFICLIITFSKIFIYLSMNPSDFSLIILFIRIYYTRSILCREKKQLMALTCRL